MAMEIKRGGEVSRCATVLQCGETGELLKSAAFNCIALGQWEAAFAYLLCLARAEGDGSIEDPGELLKALALDPTSFWRASEAIPSPYHLAWLALDTRRRLVPEKQDQIPACLSDLVEFRLLLYHSRDVVPISPHVASSLCEYHSTHVVRQTGSTAALLPPRAAADTSTPELSTDALSFIQDLLLSPSPQLGHALITALTVHGSPKHLSSNEALQLLYLNCLNKALKQLKGVRWAELDTSSSHDSQYESDHTLEGGVYGEARRLEQYVYDLLSYLDVSAEMAGLSGKVDQIFLTLLGDPATPEPVWRFDPGTIYSCLVGRRTPYLITCLHEVERYLYQQMGVGKEYVAVGNLTTAGAGTEGPEGAPPSSVAMEWKLLYHDALYSKKHLLQSVMETGVQLIQAGQLEEVARLVAHPNYAALRPLLLLLGWDKCPALENEKMLLDSLWPYEISMKQSLLYSGCCKLAFQLELVQWCLEKARPCFTSSTSKSLHPAQKAGDVFKGLETHSTLYVLHHFTPLATLDPKEVVEILKLRPHPPVLSPLVSIPPQFMTPAKASTEHTKVSLKPEQERDIAIFYSFLALKEVMEGLWCAIQLTHGTLPEEASGRRGVPSEPRVARRLDMSGEEGRSEQVYQELVQERFHRAKEYLSELYPLHYRLEVLEDIFSLLFLTSEDLKLQKNGTGEEGGAAASNGHSSHRSPTFSSRARSGSGQALAEGDGEEDSVSIASLTLIRSRHGFVVGEREAEGLIDLLQDCMVELSSARFTLLSSQPPAAGTQAGDRSPTSLVRGSIPPATLQQRSMRLNQYIHEAKWRLQLVSARHGVGATAHDQWGKSLESTSSGDSLSEVSDNEEVVDGGMAWRERRRKRREAPGGADGRKLSGDVLDSGAPSSPYLPIPQPAQALKPAAAPKLQKDCRRTSDDAQVSDVFVSTGSEQRASEDQPFVGEEGTPRVEEVRSDCSGDADIEEKVASSGPRRKCLRSHASYSSVGNRSRRRVLSAVGSDAGEAAIIPRMLASPSSLLRTCLRHANYLRAHEVVRLFGLAGQFSEALVHFSERYELVCQELCSPKPGQGSASASPALTPRSRPTPSLLSFSSASQVTGSSHLHLAIQQATRNSVALDVLHQLLAPAHVNHMLFSGDEELARNGKEFGLLRTMSERVPVLVMMDIVCSANVEGQLARTIVEQASNRCQANQSDLLPMRSFGKRRMSNDKKLLQFFNNSTSGPFALLRMLSDTSEMHLNPPSVAGPFALSCSPHCLLTTFTHPITRGSIDSFRNFASKYYSARDKLEHILNTQASSGQEGGGVGGEGKGRGVGEHFKELEDVLRTSCWVPWVQCEEEVGLMKRASRRSSSTSVDTEALLGFNFMSEFTRYLSKFVELLAKLLETNEKEAEDSLLMSVLKEKPIQLLGRLVFERNIRPEKLEKLAANFHHLKIVEVLVKSCCPQVSAMTAVPSEGRWRQLQSIVALNTSTLDVVDEEAGDLCTLSFKLLTQLVGTLKAFPRGQDDRLDAVALSQLYHTPEMQKLLAKTKLFADAHLSKLSGNNQRVMFYCNVANILYAHAIMVYAAAEKDPRLLGDLTGGSVRPSEVVQAAIFGRVGYHIGELGLVSCFDLHHIILRRGLQPTSLGDCMSSKPVWPRLSVDSPDPWASYAPKEPDPRVLYIVHCGTLFSPLPTPLALEWRSSLELAERKYLSDHCTFSFDSLELKLKVEVPSLLYRHRRDFVSVPEASNENDDMALLKYLKAKLPHDKAADIDKYLEAVESKDKKPSLKIVPSCEQLAFGYDFSSLSSGNKQGSPSGSPKSYLKPKGTELPLADDKSRPSYAFTEETLSFVEKHSTVLAALVHLLCPPVAKGTQTIESSAQAAKAQAKVAPRDAAEKTLLSPLSVLPKSLVATRSTGVVLPPEAEPEAHLLLKSILERFSPLPPMQRYLHSRLSPLLSNAATVSTDTAVDMRQLSLVANTSDALGGACLHLLQSLVGGGRVAEAVKLLSTEPVVSSWGKVQFVRDLVVSTHFVDICSKCAPEASGVKHGNVPSGVKHGNVPSGGKHGNVPSKSVLVSLLFQISDPSLAARLVLSSLNSWPVETAIFLVQYCVSHLPLSSPLHSLMIKKLEVLRVNQQVMERLSEWGTRQEGEEESAAGGGGRWKSWSDLEQESCTRPRHVLELMLEAGLSNDLIQQWAAEHKLGWEVTKLISVKNLLVWLEGTSLSPIKAYQELDQLEDERALEVCENVLESGISLHTTIFMLHYVLERLNHCTQKGDLYANKLLGAKALLCLPATVRDEYRDLVCSPILLVEQLVMDMKIELAGAVIRELRQNKYLSRLDGSDSAVVEQPPIIVFREEEEDKGKSDPFAPLLVFYCSKALDLIQPVVFQDPVSQAATAGCSAAPTRPPSRPPSPPGVGGGASSLRRQNSDVMMSPESTLKLARRSSSYEPPPLPPPKERWESDTVSKCSVCREAYFGMFNRRHHCRRCGRVVCSRCSPDTARVDGYPSPVRVCTECHQFASTNVDSDLFHGDDSLPNALLTPSPTKHWKLLYNDSLCNQNMRKSFYYEQTPNLPLALAIIDLMASKCGAAAFILDCCLTMSVRILPDSQGRVNAELDHDFVIGLMRSLLKGAKLRFADSGGSVGVELCDTYLNCIELLRVLITSGCPKIPSLQELAKPELARRVCDKLVQDDRFQLAMEICTKCQVDTTSLWGAWGMACLQIGDFPAAREKFQHCFQMSLQHNGTLLNRIVDQILEKPLSATSKNNNDWPAVVTSLKECLGHKNGDPLDPNRFIECIYYLTTHGTAHQMVAFFSRCFLWSNACRYILDHVDSCPAEVFVENLWVPALKAGEIVQVQTIMTELDPTLSRWESYLMAVCRHFTQKGLLHVLYSTQLFMKDYVRAGSTCIKFFIGLSGKATSFADLFDRRKHLSNARQHFQLALTMRQHSIGGSMGARHGGVADDTLRGGGASNKSLDIKELQLHIATIEMQQKVLDHLQRYEAIHREAVPMSLVSEKTPGIGTHQQLQPATLFGRSHTKIEVVASVMMYNHDIMEALKLGKEIIHAFKLSPPIVFSNVAEKLAEKEKYNELRALIQALESTSFASEALNDEIVMAAIKVATSKQSKETKHVEKLLQLLKSDRNQIKALVLCGKLKNAYLLAIKSKLADEVRNIAEIAEKAGQLPVRDICEKWLQANSPR